MTLSLPLFGELNPSFSGPETTSVEVCESASGQGTASGLNGNSFAAISGGEFATACQQCPELRNLPVAIQRQIANLEALFTETDELLSTIRQMKHNWLELIRAGRGTDANILMAQIQQKEVQYTQKILELSRLQLSLRNVLQRNFPRCLGPLAELIANRVIARNGTSIIGGSILRSVAKGITGTTAGALCIILEGTAFGCDELPRPPCSEEDARMELARARAEKQVLCEETFYQNFGNPPFCAQCGTDPELRRKFEEEKQACEAAIQRIADIEAWYGTCTE
jgi:hypothetical protein